MIETNIGNMKSKGLEIGINVIPVKNKDWEWTVSGNFTWNTSEITKLNTIDREDNYVKTGNAGGTGKYLQVHMVGETPNTSTCCNRLMTIMVSRWMANISQKMVPSPVAKKMPTST